MQVVLDLRREVVMHVEEYVLNRVKEDVKGLVRQDAKHRAKVGVKAVVLPLVLVTATQVAKEPAIHCVLDRV